MVSERLSACPADVEWSLTPIHRPDSRCCLFVGVGTDPHKRLGIFFRSVASKRHLVDSRPFEMSRGQTIVRVVIRIHKREVGAIVGFKLVDEEVNVVCDPSEAGKNGYQLLMM